MIYNESMGDRKIEDAIKFLVYSIENSGHNSKPVILHSMRVANMLAFLGYDSNVIIGGFLHDLHEDADVTILEIAEKFGNEVAKLVECNSFDSNIRDKRDQYKAMYNKGMSYGKDALIIKAVDLYDNSFYYHFAESIEAWNFLIEKYNYFIDTTKDILAGEKAFELLVERQKALERFVFTRSNE